MAVLLVALTLGARLPGTLHDALWQDEIGAERVISKPTVRAALGQIVHRESTPPAFYLLARATDRALSGLQVVPRARAVRGLSIAFSLACTLLTLALALEFLPLWAAALAGFLVSFGSVLVEHGSELRAYSLLAAACVAFAFVLARTTSRPVLSRLALLSGVVALGSLTHYFFLFTLTAGVLWLLTSGQTRAVLARVGAALAVGLVPLAIWSPYWLDQYSRGGYATAPPFTFARFVGLIPSLFAPHALLTHVAIAAQIAVTLAVLVSAVLLLRGPAIQRLCALFVLVPFSAVSALAWVSGERVYNTRNQIGVAPFAAIALAWGCASLPWRRVSYASGAFIAALVVAGFGYSQVSLGRTPYDRIADQVRAQGFRRDEPILWFGAYGGIFPFAWYLTSDEPLNAWPRIRISAPTKGACRAVEVVARTETGRQWLDQHRAAIITEASIPSYGDAPLGARRPDLIVARLRWSAGILDRPQGTHGWFRLHRAGTRSACVRP